MIHLPRKETREEYWRNQVRRDLWGTQVSPEASTLMRVGEAITSLIKPLVESFPRVEPLYINGVPLSFFVLQKAARPAPADKYARNRKVPRGESKRAELKKTMRQRASEEFQRLRKLEESLTIPWGKAYAAGMTR